MDLQPPSIKWPSLFLRKNGAFTLTELLIVVIVVAVMMAITLKAVSGMRSKSDVAQSANNLRSIVVATQMFASDHNGLIAMQGSPASPNQTQGPSVAPGGTGMPRALYGKSSKLGGHPLGGGDYLQDSRVFHNPRLPGLRKAPNPHEDFDLTPGGAQNIGYFYYSLPCRPDAKDLNPFVIKGQTLTNERPASSWGRTPLYSDMTDAGLTEQYAFKGDVIVVAHLDGGVSFRSKEKAIKQPSMAWRIYYLATGEPY